MRAKREDSGSSRLPLVLLILGLAALNLAAAPVSFGEEDTLDKIIRTKEFHIGFVVLPPGISKDQDQRADRVLH